MSAAEKIAYPDLMGHRIQVAEVARIVYQVCVEPGTPREALQRPDFWKHVAQKFQPYTRLEVVTDDGEYFCELLVIAAESNWAKVIELNFKDLRNEEIIQEAAKAPEYHVKWKGPHKKWCVIRNKDGEEIKSELPDKTSAAVALNEYVKVINK